MPIDIFSGWQTFVTILLLTFALFLVITGAFTAYFGSGKSRKIGGGLLGGGLVIGVLWVIVMGPLNSSFGLWDVVLQTVVILIAALIGAAAAIGLFLLAIMKS
ncbi:MAG: hypothetical protein E6K17_03060 [Methanobacteriota archaeon]|nr:MAG: hypothetical protein E6K17_03060 [Euryarchaeota archaeon]